MTSYWRTAGKKVPQLSWFQVWSQSVGSLLTHREVSTLSCPARCRLAIGVAEDGAAVVVGHGRVKQRADFGRDGLRLAHQPQEKVDSMEKRELEQRVFSEYNSYFQWFVGLAILILVIEFLRS